MTALPPPQLAMLRLVQAGYVRYAHHTGGIVTVGGINPADDTVRTRQKACLRALERKKLVALPARRRGYGVGQVTVTAAGQKVLAASEAGATDATMERMALLSGSEG